PEGDFVRTAGVFRGKLGKKVAASNVSLVDDGSIQEIDGHNFFGFLPYDDEGVKTRRIDIIDDGVLKLYMNDRSTAHYWDAEPTGNARAMFFSNQPIVRMRNTWLEATNDSMSQEELIEAIGNGLLLKKSKGGQVDPIRGTFNFGTGEIWLIENGEVTDRKRPTTAAGNTIQTLKSIIGINDKFDNVTHSTGFCVIGMQAVPTSIGGGWMAVKNIIIG
ncbi:MAG: TldD/PmbA family protein, partial [Candidatus Heimdallarchaeota archaeon]|nr:TldD/PmbA family protein [Candidatus Heimdallarchaeota archaeon]MCK5049917.1 TldD/PmbA family protein [Candidatus Heimdallarchaeota archaeon]